jgi:hypothetical protein
VREQRLAIDLDPNGRVPMNGEARLTQLENALATSPIN